MNSVAVWYIEDEDEHLTEDKPFTEARACGKNSIEAGGNYCYQVFLWGETSCFFALFFFWKFLVWSPGNPGGSPLKLLESCLVKCRSAVFLFSVCLSTFPWNNLADVEQKLHRPQWNGSESRGFVKAAADGTDGKCSWKHARRQLRRQRKQRRACVMCDERRQGGRPWPITVQTPHTNTEGWESNP